MTKWIDEIEVRAWAATPGPWTSWIDGRDHAGGRTFIQTSCEDLYLTGATQADHDFIAHARQDVPRLIAEVRGLQRMLRTLAP